MHWHYGQLGNIDEEQLGRLYDQRVVLRLLGYLRPYRTLTLLSVLGMLLYTLTIVAMPWIIQQAIDSVVASQSLAGLRTAVLLFAANAVVNYAANYFHLRALAQMGQRVLYDLRTHLFHHLQRLSLSFFDRNEVGRVMSRIQNDVQQLQEFLSILILGLGDLLTLLGIIAAMLLMHLPLALITLTVLPVLFLIMVVWQRYAQVSFMRVRRAIAMVNVGLQENISGVRVIQSLNRQEANIERFDQLNSSHLDANLQASRLSSALLPTVEVLTAVATGLIIVFGGAMVLRGELAVGVLVAFALYIQRFFDPIRNLTMQYTQLQRAMTSGARIFELLDTQPEVTDRPDAQELPRIRGEIRFEDVSFAYQPGQEVLHHIHLHIRPGETVALVGPTGAGKTTLVALAARFYDVTQGCITTDGVDIRQLSQASLASQRAMVLQEPFLFSGTIAENIRYCREGLSDEEIIRAARLVGAHEFITRLPQGYDMPVQERGGNLSVGQRQLIALARAVAAAPHILTLDEATASIDSHTEMLIQQALKQVLQGRTSLVIAHRLSTVRSADRIVVLDGGRIVEEGSHEALLRQGGLYTQLYRLHFAGEPAPAGDGQPRLRP
ncbi:MAG: ABC transporter ATP-binding protein, partial [Dehalococcoidia bacterium]